MARPGLGVPAYSHAYRSHAAGYRVLQAIQPGHVAVHAAGHQPLTLAVRAEHDRVLGAVGRQRRHYARVQAPQPLLPGRVHHAREHAAVHVRKQLHLDLRKSARRGRYR